MLHGRGDPQRHGFVDVTDRCFPRFAVSRATGQIGNLRREEPVHAAPGNHDFVFAVHSLTADCERRLWSRLRSVRQHGVQALLPFLFVHDFIAQYPVVHRRNECGPIRFLRVLGVEIEDRALVGGVRSLPEMGPLRLQDKDLVIRIVLLPARRPACGSGTGQGAVMGLENRLDARHPSREAVHAFGEVVHAFGEVVHAFGEVVHAFGEVVHAAGEIVHTTG